MKRYQTHIKHKYPEDAIAVVGLACRLPGTGEIHDFWDTIVRGREWVRDLSREELLEAGEEERIIDTEDYVARASYIDDATAFDADFFGLTPREAELMDPQQRILLQCAWRALESAGYVPDAIEQPVGVFAGSSISTYLTNHLLKHPDADQLLQDLRVRTGNDKDFTASRISYLLNLTGPAISMNTACSTSLVALHEACKSLLLHECDMALAAGVSVKWHQKFGYQYQQGGIASPDGRCRPFDALASGTIGGNGAGVVVLKRIKDAIADRDPIRAIVRGRAINNDGRNKVGYTAPSVQGQRDVIKEALLSAGVGPESIGYIETHGTGTQLGDPIEIEALKQAFGATEKKQYCALGSVKPNIGHLDAAAGVAGFIKAVLVVEHGRIPPLTHFTSPNPELELGHSPFYIPQQEQPWNEDVPLNIRRAGVSSFGIGGTNVHLILEESPVQYVSGAGDSPADEELYLFPVSARDAESVRNTINGLAADICKRPSIDLQSVSATLVHGRKSFSSRSCMVARSTGDLCRQLEHAQALPVQKAHPDASVIFVFQGQNQFPAGTTRALYETEPEFREAMDECMAHCSAHSDIDIRKILYADADDTVLKDVVELQPVKLAIEYSLARWLMSKGIKPAAMIGHSIGEYAAACISGAMDLSTAMNIISNRGRIMSGAPDGGMTAIYASADETAQILNQSGSGATISAENSTRLTVISASVEQLDQTERYLAGRSIDFKRLGAAKAYHSEMMRPVRKQFLEILNQCIFSKPVIPFISNVSGTWITDAQATDAQYWADHMEQAVRFTDGIRTLEAAHNHPVFVEIGVGASLTNLVRQITGTQTDPTITLFNPQADADEQRLIWRGLAECWSRGARPDWTSVNISEDTPRIHLPGYSFRSDEHVVNMPQSDWSTNGHTRREGLAFYTPMQTPAPLMPSNGAAPCGPVLIGGFDRELVRATAEKLRAQQVDVIAVCQADSFKEGGTIVHLDITNPDQCERWIHSMQQNGPAPGSALWLHTPETEDMDNGELFLCLKRFSQGLLQMIPEDIRQFPLLIASGDDGAVSSPGGVARAFVTVMMQEETPRLQTKFVELAVKELRHRERMATVLTEEWSAMHDYTISRKGARRFTTEYTCVGTYSDVRERPRLVRENGNYLITGGLGNVGRVIGEFLAGQKVRSIGILTRRAFPGKSEWEILLNTLRDQDTAGTGEQYGDRVQLQQALEQVISLEQSGVDVHVISADVSKPESLNQAFAEFETRCDPAQGIIHAAGITSGSSIGVPYGEIGPGELEIQIHPKLQGARNLIAWGNEHQPDFILMISSNAAELGGLGLGAYAAASRAMDQQVLQLFDEVSFPIITSNWDGWPRPSTEDVRPAETDLERLALTADEAKRSLAFILDQTSLPQIIVSKSDYTTRARRWHYPWKVDEEPGISETRLGEENRPELSSVFVEAEDDLEQELVSIWQELLGIQPVGIHDNFFELRGDSLLATRMLTLIRQRMGHKIPLKALFESLTIRRLHEWMDRNLSAPNNGEPAGEPPEEIMWEEGEL